MATFNSTESPVTKGFAGFSANLLSMPELEKISCSVKGKAFIHPLQLMGKTIRFGEVVESEIGLGEGWAHESLIAIGTVLAVHLGSVQHGIETSLLISQDGGSDPYYADISKLTVLEVLE